METLRIAHLSDTHLGYRAYAKADPESGRNQRTVDFERSFWDAVTQIIDLEPDLVVHAGDVFHHPRPDWRSVGAFIAGIRRLEEAGLPVVVISGNHDISRLRTSSTVYDTLAEALPQTHFISGWSPKASVVRPLPTVAVIGLPVPDPAAMVDIVWPAREWKILVSHGGLASNLTPPQYQKISGIAWFDPKEFDYVALGDHHISYRAGDKTWYSGSTERCGFSDENATPGFLVVELEKGRAPGIEHVSVACRPMKTLQPVSWTDHLELVVADVVEQAHLWNEPDGLCRVEIQDAPRGSIGIVQRRVDQLLKRTGAAWHCIVYSGVTSEDPGRVNLQAVDPVETFDVAALFEQFVEEGQYDPAFQEKFFARGAEALRVARELEQSRGGEE